MLATAWDDGAERLLCSDLSNILIVAMVVHRIGETEASRSFYELLSWVKYAGEDFLVERDIRRTRTRRRSAGNGVIRIGNTHQRYSKAPLAMSRASLQVRRTVTTLAKKATAASAAVASAKLIFLRVVMAEQVLSSF